MLNLQKSSTGFKNEFIEYIKITFIEVKTNQFFDIISNYPDSMPALSDIKYALTQSDVILYLLL